MLIRKQRELIKKVISATSAFVIAAGIATPVTNVSAAASYADVTANDWYYSYVTEASDKGIVSGYEDNTFRPTNTITLSECLKMVLNYKGITCEKGEYHWASNYWDKAHEMSLVVWGEFDSPDKQLSRQQVARIVVRALDEDYVYCDTSLIPDYGLVGDDYKQYVEQAYAKGIISGYEDGSFIGDKAVTRAEILSILERAFNPNSRTTIDTANRKTGIAYVRKDIDIRVNGIHTAMMDYNIVQKGDEIYIPYDYFYTDDKSFRSFSIRQCYTDVNYMGYYAKALAEKHKAFADETTGSTNTNIWLFRNDWQVTNEVVAVEASPLWKDLYREISDRGVDPDEVGFTWNEYHHCYSLTYLKEHGIQVEYDAENRIVYLGEKEIKLYQTTKDKLEVDGTRILKWSDAYTRDTPIVSFLVDRDNCAMCPLDAVRRNLYPTSCSYEACGPQTNMSGYTIMNITGMDVLHNPNTTFGLWDLETGVQLWDSYITKDPRSEYFRCDFDLNVEGVNYIISTNEFGVFTSNYISLHQDS